MRKSLATIAAIFTLSMLSFSFVAPTAHAVNINSILAGQICEPDNSTAGYSTNLGRCINNIYVVSLAVAGVIAVLMFIIAGYMYSTGTDAAVTKAKSIIGSTIAALVILFGAFAILNTIDPEFTKIPTIQAPNIDCSEGRCDTTVPGTDGAPVTPPPTPPPGDHPDVPESPDALKATANDILNNGNIYLARGHVSGVNDWATARQNVVDAANGLQATRSDYQNAPGGSVTLNSQMLNALSEIGKKYKINVSEIAGGSHSVNSRHYQGTAFDINVVNGVHLVQGRANVASLASAIMALCTQYGATQVLDETGGGGNHVHCAW